MFNSFARVALLVIVAALIVAPGSAQPPPVLPDGMPDEAKTIRDMRSYYTAFPGIMTPTPEWREVMQPDGTILRDRVIKFDVPPPPLPVLAADAPTLQKVRHAQAREGLIYLARIREIIQIGSWSSQFFRQYVCMVTETYQAAAELEETPARRVRWYVARIRKFKEVDRFNLIRTINGSDPPQRIEFGWFARLQAEAELLKLEAEVEKAEGASAVRPMIRKPDPTNSSPKDGSADRDTGYTAFPDLKPGAVEKGTFTEPGGQVRVFQFIDTAVRPPRLPVLPPNATQFRRVRREQVLEGLECLHRIAEIMRTGAWNSQFFDEAIETASDTYRRGADLELNPADQVPWHEARVRVLKEFELFTEARVKGGNDPPQLLNVARFRRLNAEADLLALLVEVKNAGPQKDPPIKREAFEFKRKRPVFTAFPDLKPPLREVRVIGDPTLVPPVLEIEEVDVVPLPPLPILPPDAPRLQQVRYEQLRAGLGFLDRIKQVTRIGSWTSQFLTDYLDVATGVYRVGASLETTAAKRQRWYEARVAKLKGIEQFIKSRVDKGNDPEHRLNLVRIRRLQAEAELLVLTSGVAAIPAVPVPLCSRPSVCPRPPGERVSHLSNAADPNDFLK